MTTTAPTSVGHVEEAPLQLRGVLDTVLPRELGTKTAPDRYTVAAVFSRRVSGQERALIEQESVRRLLAEKGYPGVELTVEDRRLLIANTNLAMLEAGLAHEIAAVLHHVEEWITAERTRTANELDEWRALEFDRAAGVKAESDRVRFE